MCTPALANYGSDELKRNYLAPSIAGDLVGCIGVSESGGGSDVSALKTTARKDGGDYVINGEKMWITNGTQADWMCMLANTSEGKPHENKSLIVVPMDAPEFMWRRNSTRWACGLRIPPLYSLMTSACLRVTLIGPMEGLGFMQQMAQFQDERIWGCQQRLWARGGDESHHRVSAGAPNLRAVPDGQSVHHFKMSELSTEIQALKALTYRAAELHGKRGAMDLEVVRLASMAKFKSGRLSREVLDWCLQFHGGMGYMFETRINRMFRDTRLIGIGVALTKSCWDYRKA